MNAFWALVRNDFRIARGHRHSRQGKFWRRFYLCLILASVFTIYTISLIYGWTTPEFMYMAPSFLMFWSFIAPLGVVKREWSGDTASWWLSLPYSRTCLLGAKFVASLLRALIITLAVFLVSLVLWLEGILVRPDIWGHYNLSELFMKIGQVYGMFLIISPVLITLGLVMAVVSRTKWRPLMPLMGLSFSAIISLVFSWLLGPFRTTEYGVLFYPNGISLFETVLGILGALLIGTLLFRAAVYLLEKQVEL